MERLATKCQSGFWFAIIGAFICLFGRQVNAQVTYTYTGQNYNPETHECNGTYLPCTQLFVSGSFTVPQALAPNISFSTFTPSSFSFTDNSGIFTLTSDTGLGLETFEVSTDNNGSIWYWNLFLQVVNQDFCVPDYNEAIFSTYDLSNGQGSDASCYSNSSNYGSGGNGNAPGSWVSNGCSITSQTVAQQPPDIHRTTLGVGEVVSLALMGGDGSTTWELKGAGNLAELSGADVMYMASGSPGEVEITAKANTCSSSPSIKFNVIAPSTVVMQNSMSSGNNYCHTRDHPDLGFVTNVFIGPDTVSFENVSFQEVNGLFTVSGVYGCEKGEFHCPNGCSPVSALQNTVLPGKGTQLDGMDTVYSGDPAAICGVAPPYTPGQIGISIPWQWYLDNTNPVTFLNVTQDVQLGANGSTLNASKAGVTMTKAVVAPDGAESCGTSSGGDLK